MLTQSGAGNAEQELRRDAGWVEIECILGKAFGSVKLTRLLCPDGGSQ